jgi:hypothetical protein
VSAVHLDGLDAFSEKAAHMSCERERARLRERIRLIGKPEDFPPIEHHESAGEMESTGFKHVNHHIVGARFDHGLFHRRTNRR